MPVRSTLQLPAHRASHGSAVLNQEEWGSQRCCLGLAGHRDWPYRKASVPKWLRACDPLVPWLSRRLPSMTCPSGTHLAVLQLGFTFTGVLGGSLGRSRRGPSGWGLQAPKVQKNRCPPGLLLGILWGQARPWGTSWPAREARLCRHGDLCTDQHLGPHHLLGDFMAAQNPQSWKLTEPSRRAWPWS